ncbi:MAG: hypothetical protein NUV65_00620 [Candidatus Roizmanbacteria bacterium]|nr:hypothetical protein [Candidatus Roizmanbacteria bacterium]
MTTFIKQAAIFLGVFFLFCYTSVLATTKPHIYFFYGKGCPHCANVEQYFQSENLYKKYAIDVREVYFDHDNATLFTNLMNQLEVPQDQRGVPTIIMGSTLLSGDKPIIEQFVATADKYLHQDTSIAVAKSVVPKSQQGLQLTLFAVIAGSIVDAINPCAFAVLIILMSTIITTGAKKKALYTGLSFTLSIFISYFLMGLGLYQAFGTGSFIHYIYQFIGWVAILLGLLNLKDYLWYGKGVLMEVPLSWRPQLKKLITSITSPLGAFLIGFLVSLFLLPCTSGPYIVILSMLAKQTLQLKALAYLLLYNLIFITPMIAITLAVYLGYSPKKIEEIRQKHLRTVHLIGGIILLLIGGVMIMRWL